MPHTPQCGLGRVKWTQTGVVSIQQTSTFLATITSKQFLNLYSVFYVSFRDYAGTGMECEWLEHGVWRIALSIRRLFIPIIFSVLNLAGVHCPGLPSECYYAMLDILFMFTYPIHSLFECYCSSFSLGSWFYAVPLHEMLHNAYNDLIINQIMTTICVPTEGTESYNALPTRRLSMFDALRDVLWFSFPFCAHPNPITMIFT